MQVLGQINQRFDELTGEITIEVRKQCETTKQAAADMVKTAAKRTFDGQLELGRSTRTTSCSQCAALAGSRPGPVRVRAAPPGAATW